VILSKAVILPHIYWGGGVWKSQEIS